MESQVQLLQGGHLDETDSSHLLLLAILPTHNIFSECLCWSWMCVPVLRSLLSIHPATQKHPETQVYAMPSNPLPVNHLRAAQPRLSETDVGTHDDQRHTKNQGLPDRLARRATPAGYGEVLLESLTAIGKQIHGLWLPVPSGIVGVLAGRGVCVCR